MEVFNAPAAQHDGTRPDPIRADGLWADDLHPGYRLTSGEIELTAEAIINFGRAFDPQIFHTDEEAARNTFFGALVASGWHTGSLTMRLFLEALPLATGVVGAGGELCWPTPSVPGDRLRIDGSINAVRWSRAQPGRALLDLSYDTLNQHGEVRMRTRADIVAWARQ